MRSDNPVSKTPGEILLGNQSSATELHWGWHTLNVSVSEWELGERQAL